jgi:hypothetical protein
MVCGFLKKVFSGISIHHSDGRAWSARLGAGDMAGRRMFWELLIMDSGGLWMMF